MGRDRIDVVLKGYPRLSETFIAQELLALERAGKRLALWSLRHPYDDKTHPMHAAIAAPVTYLPEYLHEEPRRVLRALLAVRHLAGFGRALKIWWEDLRRDPTRNRCRRFGQAAVLAHELPVDAALLYAHFLHTPSSVTRYAAIMRGLPWGFSAHAKDIWTTPAWEKREKLAEAAFAVTCTATNAAHLCGMARAAERVRLVYHGLDLERFPPPPTREAHRSGLTLLSVGRLVEKKGYDGLLDALAMVPGRVDWRLQHIGGGPLADAMRAKAARLGIAERIDWLGKRDQTDVIAAMRAADLFVLPSRIAEDGDRDGLPNVLMEAASQTLPILSTAISAIPEFIDSGMHGTLVPPDDPAALAEALVALADDPAGRARMAEAARARLIEQFGMHAGIAVLLGLMDDALGKARMPDAA